MAWSILRRVPEMWHDSILQGREDIRKSGERRQLSKRVDPGFGHVARGGLLRDPRELVNKVPGRAEEARRETPRGVDRGVAADEAVGPNAQAFFNHVVHVEEHREHTRLIHS